jgi:hypothetical protein
LSQHVPLRDWSLKHILFLWDFLLTFSPDLLHHQIHPFRYELVLVVGMGEPLHFVSRHRKQLAIDDFFGKMILCVKEKIFV